MLSVEFKVDPAQERRIVELMRSAPLKTGRAVARALNRGLDHAATLGKREIATELGLKQKTVGDTFAKFKATPQRLVAQLRITGKRIPLGSFGARELAGGTVTFRRRKPGLKSGVKSWKQRVRTRGVSYKIGRQGRVTGRNLFFGVGVRRFGDSEQRSGRVVYTRDPAGAQRKRGVRPGRLSDTRLLAPRGPSIPQIAANNPQLQQIWRIDVTETTNRRITHELDRLLQPGEGG